MITHPTLERSTYYVPRWKRTDARDARSNGRACTVERPCVHSRTAVRAPSYFGLGPYVHEQNW